MIPDNDRPHTSPRRAGSPGEKNCRLPGRVPVPLLRRCATVRWNWCSLGRTNPHRKDRDPRAAQSAQRPPDIARSALAVGQDEHRLIASLAFMVEGGGGG